MYPVHWAYTVVNTFCQEGSCMTQQGFIQHLEKSGEKSKKTNV